MIIRVKKKTHIIIVNFGYILSVLFDQNSLAVNHVEASLTRLQLATHHVVGGAAGDAGLQQHDARSLVGDGEVGALLVSSHYENDVHVVVVALLADGEVVVVVAACAGVGGAEGELRGSILCQEAFPGLVNRNLEHLAAGERLDVGGPAAVGLLLEEACVAGVPALESAYEAIRVLDRSAAFNGDGGVAVLQDGEGELAVPQYHAGCEARVVAALVEVVGVAWLHVHAAATQGIRPRVVLHDLPVAKDLVNRSGIDAFALRLELERIVLEAPALPGADHHVFIDLLARFAHGDDLVGGDAEVVERVVRTGIELELHVVQRHVVVLCAEVDVVALAVLDPLQGVVGAGSNRLVDAVLIGPAVNSGVLDDLESPLAGGELGCGSSKTAISLYERDAVLREAPAVVVTRNDVGVLCVGHTDKGKGRHQKSKQFLHSFCLLNC